MSHSVEDDIDESCDYDELPIKADTPELADQSSAPNSFEFPSLWGTLVSLDTEMEHIGKTTLIIYPKPPVSQHVRDKDHVPICNF